MTAKGFAGFTRAGGPPGLRRRGLTAFATITAALVAIATATFAATALPASAQDQDVEGAWQAETYVLKGGAEHRVEGRIFFTESDWQVLFFVVDERGDIKRGSAEGGTYTLEGDALTFWHLHNFSTGEAMEGLAEAPLRMVYRDLENAPQEPSNVYAAGERLTLAFPSGNRLLFTRSSR